MKNCPPSWDITEVVNFHWIAIVLTGLYTHLRQICIIGFCFDDESAHSLPFDHSYASIIFVFSVLCLLAEYKLWPKSLKEPPIHLMFVYEILVAALVTNLTVSLIWTPLMHGIYCLTSEAANGLLFLHQHPFLAKMSFLESVANYLRKDMAASHSAMCLSILSFVWMLDATESLDGIFDLLIKDDDSCSVCVRQNKKKKKKKKISFSNPEVSNYFWYSIYKNWIERWGKKVT